jgi:hypothetical protein
MDVGLFLIQEFTLHSTGQSRKTDPLTVKSPREYAVFLELTIAFYYNELIRITMLTIVLGIVVNAARILVDVRIESQRKIIMHQTIAMVAVRRKIRTKSGCIRQLRRYKKLMIYL